MILLLCEVICDMYETALNGCELFENSRYEIALNGLERFSSILTGCHDF